MKRTNPMTWSAPLDALADTDEAIINPTSADLRAELKRAQTELMYAIHRHRAAWAHMRKLKEEFGERNLDYLDNERPWKLAIGDVSWWRGEMNCQSNAIIALRGLLADRQAEAAAYPRRGVPGMSPDRFPPA